MKLSPMTIQGLWEYKSPLLQLPHITDDNLKYFQTKKRYVRSLQQLAKLPSDESRAMLRNLTDEEYNNVIKVLARMPLIDFSIRCEVVDDDHTNVVTAGAIVTVYVNLVRRSMQELFGDMKAIEKQSIKADDQPQPEIEENENGEVVVKENNTTAVAEENKDDGKAKESNKPKKPVWMKQKAHKGGKSKSKAKSKSQLKPAGATAAAATTNQNSKETAKESTKTKSSAKPAADSDESGAESENENEIEKEDGGSSDPDDDRKTSSVEDDDMEWEK